MSLILVVARVRPEADETTFDSEPISARSTNDRTDAWVGWVTGGIRPANGELTVEYTGHPAAAAAAARGAIEAGYRDVAVIPVAGTNSHGPTGFDAADLARLQAVTAALAERHPEAAIVLVGSPPDEPPTFTEILALLHPPESADPELLEAAVGRAFDGDADRFGQFVRALQEGVPRGTQLALRGSAVQGYSYKTLEPFDARGPRTSDLDMVLLGDEVMAAWDPEAFFVPAVNTMPLADETAWVAPSLEPARRRAQAIAGRPVSVQAMARWFIDLRSAFQGTPYVLLDA